MSIDLVHFDLIQRFYSYLFRGPSLHQNRSLIGEKRHLLRGTLLARSLPDDPSAPGGRRRCEPGARGDPGPARPGHDRARGRGPGMDRDPRGAEAESHGGATGRALGRRSRLLREGQPGPRGPRGQGESFCIRMDAIPHRSLSDPLPGPSIRRFVHRSSSPSLAPQDQVGVPPSRA